MSWRQHHSVGARDMPLVLFWPVLFTFISQAADHPLGDVNRTCGTGSGGRIMGWLCLQESLSRTIIIQNIIQSIYPGDRELQHHLCRQQNVHYCILGAQQSPSNVVSSGTELCEQACQLAPVRDFQFQKERRDKHGYPFLQHEFISRSYLCKEALGGL